MNPWFDDLGRRLAAAAGRRGKPIEAPVLDPALAAELLELARVAAHTQERRFAPLASYLAGSAMTAAGLSGEEAAAVVREVREELEGVTATESEAGPI
ncbi:MAG TPA: DUF6457 domain-containing protein [Candidatus Dormibacteraeota bacterium]